MEDYYYKTFFFTQKDIDSYVWGLLPPPPLFFLILFFKQNVHLRHLHSLGLKDTIK